MLILIYWVKKQNNHTNTYQPFYILFTLCSDTNPAAVTTAISFAGWTFLLSEFPHFNNENESPVYSQLMYLNVETAKRPHVCKRVFSFLMKEKNITSCHSPVSVQK